MALTLIREYRNDEFPEHIGDSERVLLQISPSGHFDGGVGGEVGEGVGEGHQGDGAERGTWDSITIVHGEIEFMNYGKYGSKDKKEGANQKRFLIEI